MLIMNCMLFIYKKNLCGFMKMKFLKCAEQGWNMLKQKAPKKPTSYSSNTNVIAAYCC